VKCWRADLHARGFQGAIKADVAKHGGDPDVTEQAIGYGAAEVPGNSESDQSC